MDFTYILTPAITISLLAFLAKFFGKIITDQNPFTDERGWDIELNGFNFMLGLTSYGTIGVALALAWQWTSISWIAHAVILFLVIFIGGILLFADIAMANKKYNLEHPDSEKNTKEFFTKHPKLKQFYLDSKAGYEFLAKVGSCSPIWLIQIIIPYLVVQEYFKQNIFWFIVLLSQAFLALIFLALKYSLNKIKLPKVDIIFSDSQPALSSVMLLKVNADNIRLRDKNKIIILNKDRVARIEMDIKQN